MRKSLLITFVISLASIVLNPFVIFADVSTSGRPETAVGTEIRGLPVIYKKINGEDCLSVLFFTSKKLGHEKSKARLLEYLQRQGSAIRYIQSIPEIYFVYGFMPIDKFSKIFDAQISFDTKRKVWVTVKCSSVPESLKGVIIAVTPDCYLYPQAGPSSSQAQ